MKILKAKAVLVAALIIGAMLTTSFSLAHARFREPLTNGFSRAAAAAIPKNTAANARRVKQATLSSEQIKAVRNTEGIKDAVTITGTIIKPRAGVSLWSLGNLFVLQTNSTKPNVTPEASQIVLTNLPGGTIHFALCICTFSGGNDACKFKGDASAANCGGQHCCGFHEGDILPDGTVKLS